ncbi:unnamed protein product [Lepeophtheirus salmonis]|uniref:(salmon louse) hypothetical protein n=1 Tax=Lepeophtheirus salmonis TaxID=72036 RepID=A0A7R8CYZ5_LEPSM|nr:unnamed protein product [Lepeophtheirus salmonis]CAF2972575.1 unnamed protein product [Lepeophtheirus salmonis]
MEIRKTLLLVILLHILSFVNESVGDKGGKSMEFDSLMNTVTSEVQSVTSELTISPITYLFGLVIGDILNKILGAIIKNGTCNHHRHIFFLVGIGVARHRSFHGEMELWDFLQCQRRVETSFRIYKIQALLHPMKDSLKKKVAKVERPHNNAIKGIKFQKIKFSEDEPQPKRTNHPEEERPKGPGSNFQGTVKCFGGVPFLAEGSEWSLDSLHS